MLDKNLDREASDKLAAERVLKARTELILSRRFYGVLVSNVDVVITRSVPTAATNGTKHFWNPDFVAKLTQKQLLTVQKHESEHDARHHGTRRGERDPVEWNKAADYAINIDLVDEGDEFPPEDVLGGKPLIDEKYRGMSAEDIYRSRELDEKAKQQPPQPPNQDGDDGQDDESEPGENADTDPGNGEQDSDDQDGDQGDDGDEAEDDQDGGQGGQGEPQGEPEADDQGEGQGGAQDDDQGEGQGGAQDDAQDGQGGGDGQGDPQDGTEGQGQGGDGPSEDDTEDQGEEPVSTGDFPGSLGEVLDSADDAGELSNEDTRWERVVRQAAALAKGDAPGHVSREIERANNPPQDWRERLRAWIDGGTKRIETWNRPNRRFIGSGTILPGSQRDGVNRVVAAIDTSGSMDDIALACVNKEVQAALDEGAIDELVVVYGDTRVTRVDTYHAGDEVEFDPRGGGGTDLRPMFEYIRENIEDPSGMLVFTDLFIGGPDEQGPAPDCPVLFAVTGYPQTVRELIANNVPWGADGIDVGAH